jgi:hypothetical protein
LIGDKPWKYPERIEKIFSVPEGLMGELFRLHVVDLKRSEEDKFYQQGIEQGIQQGDISGG